MFQGQTLQMPVNESSFVQAPNPCTPACGSKGGGGGWVVGIALNHDQT